MCSLRNLALRAQYSLRVVLATLRATYSDFPIPEREPSSWLASGYVTCVPLAGIEPASIP